MIARTVVIVAVGLLLLTGVLQAQDRSRYRDFQLGADMSSVSAFTKVAAADAKTIHQRPALIQELDWRPRYYLSGTTPTGADPVRQIVFSFYNDQLFRLVINYDRQRTDGLTDADLIEAISTAYGPPLKPAVGKSSTTSSELDREAGMPIARWGDAEHSVVLYRASYGSELRLIVLSPRLDALARTAAAQAVRLDDREAPQREIARQKQEAENTRVSQEKARIANKDTFRP